MKIFFWIGICIVTIVCRVSAQDTAVVTNIRQEVRIYPAWRSILSEESFPDAIQTDTLWQSSVKARLQQLLRQKFGVAQVIFSKPEPVDYVVTGNTSLTHTPPAITGDLMVDIHMVITPTTTSMEETGIVSKNFNQTCRILIKNKENKPLYESTIVLPFRTRVNPDAGMYGLAELSDADLKQLFEESMAAVFKYTSKKLPSRTFNRPAISNANYKAFLKKAQLYALHEFMPDVPLQKGQPQQNWYRFQPVHIKADTMKLSLTRNYTGNVRSPEEGFTCRAVLKNDYTEANYQMWASFQWKNKQEDATAPVGDEKPEVVVKCFSERLQLGDFTLSSKKFEGMTGYTSFTIYQASPKNTLELRLNNQVKALIQKSSVSRSAQEKIQQYYLYLPAEASQEEKAELLTIFMIYKVVSEFGQDYL